MGANSSTSSSSGYTTTTCTGASPQFFASTVTGSASVTSHRGSTVTYYRTVSSDLVSSTALSSAMANLKTDVATLVSKINAAYLSSGASYTALTTAGITVHDGSTSSSAGTVAPFFGMLLAMLFAVLSF